jgi:ABC-2 type transport system permease protein
MGTLLAIARFESASRLKRISTHVYFIVFATLAALWMAAAGGVFQNANVSFGTEKVFINSPFALAQTVAIMGFLGVVVIAAVMGRSVQQDFEYQSFHFFFTSPIRKSDYFFGRFLGAIAVLVYIFAGIMVGVLIGTHLPGVLPERVGPWSLRAMAQPYLVNLLPNVLFLGAAFFGLAALTRRMMPVYVAGIIVLVGYLAATRLIADMDNRTLAALIDPIGSSAMSTMAKYWTAAEKNTRLMPFTGELLWNRALWTTVGLAIMAFCYVRFSMGQGGEQSPRRQLPLPVGHDSVIARVLRGLARLTPFWVPVHYREGPQYATVVQDTPEAPAKRTVALPQVTQDISAAAYIRQLPGLVALYARETVKNVYFSVIVLTGVLFVLSNAKVVGSAYGTNTYPVTYQVLDFVSGSFALFMLIVTAFYAGELVWRERDARAAQLTDSTPTPTWLPFVAKLLTLCAMQTLLQVVVMICGLLVQIFSGYTKFELSQYIYRLFALQLPTYWTIAALALFIHVVVNNKYLGYFIIVLYYIAEIAANAMGYSHRLYLYGEEPGFLYSDMNGYGNFIPAIRWFQAYWGFGALLLLIGSMLLWVRGVDDEFKVRLAVARARFTTPMKLVTAISLVAMAGLGSWIFYNTNVLNIYRTEFAEQELQANYEKQYKALQAKPQPKITGVKIAVDIFPHEHRIRLAGTYKVANKSDAAIPEVYVLVMETAKIHALKSSLAWTEVESHPEMNWHRFKLAQPLGPGASMDVDFDLEYAPEGFGNGGASNLVLDNGTFMNSIFVPHFGYSEAFELSQDSDRKKHGLEPKDRMPDLDNVAARNRNYISGDGDWLAFDATVSTDADQIGIAPGYLQREWTENGRRYFHYTMDRPILNFYAFLSARYEVKRDVWHPQAENVPIEIYYNKGHEYDLDAMDQSVKDSLDYYTKNFSPYQHHQVRILEFPRYQAFAQSFPNTIPFSEGIGFIAKVDPKDPKDIDYPYYVTAHEVAHQWWAHQVIGAYTQGATLMSETLAQYSALMVMKHKYGDAKMKRFLKYELDNYLRSRGVERKKELPLYRVENQGYIHYRKGSLAMYELQDVIGEDNVNRALASYIKKVAFQNPPYTISRELLAEFRAVTPPDKQYLITDLFESIVLFENRAIEASAKEAGPGAWDVTFKVEAKKLKADETGVQNEIPMDDWVDIGVLGKDDKPLFLEKRRIKSGESTFTVRVTEEPKKAGIDPVNKLIDRRPEDNTMTVSIK